MPPGLLGPNHVFGDEAVVADRLEAELVEEPAQPAGVVDVGGAPRRVAIARVARGAAGVGGVLSVSGELHLVDADVGEELEQLAPTTRKGDERTEVGRILGKVGATQEAQRRIAGGDGEPAGDVTLGERDGADLPGGISRPLPAKAVSGSKALVVTPTANPALAPRKRRRLRPPDDRRALRARMVLLLE